MRGAAMLCAGSILWASCQKENDGINVPTEEVTNSILRQSGVAPDDPALVAKVPKIVSADFLADTITNYFSFQPQTEAAKGGGGGRDRTTPQVTITSPGSGTVVTGTVGVNVSATDNVGITSVVLTADGNVVGTISVAPFSFSWNTSGLSSGTHTLTATATDAAGNTKTHSIQVGYNTTSGADITPPLVSITSPVNGSSVTSTISVAVSASDNVGVTAVNFKVDGASVATDNSSPYNFSWNTSTVSAGIHTLSATATDGAGNSNTSSIQVTVNTTVVPPSPSLPTSVELMMPPVAHQGSEGSCVSFAVGYAARSAETFYRTNASSYNNSTNVFSPEFLFNLTTSDSYCSSSALISALEKLKSTGICTWDNMPYSTSNGCSLLPTTSQYTEASSFKIASYSSIYTSDLTAIKTMLAAKRPLMITFSIDQNFTNAAPGFIWRSYSSTNGARHAVAICGYDDAKRAVKVMNSWGTGWGDNGYTWIDYDFLPSLNPSVYVMNF